MNRSSQDYALILIVDDTPSNLGVIAEALSGAGFEIAIATSGERALAQSRVEPPDLILLDIMMPGIGGFETCKRLKSDAQLCQIPVLFMTALNDIENKIKGFDLGAVDYITKPFQEKEVLARIGTHLNLRKAQLQLQRSEEQLSEILGALQEVVWSAFIEPFELLYLNHAVETIYGCPVSMFMEHPSYWINQIHQDDRGKLQDYLSDANTESSIDLEYRVVRTDGETRWVHCQAQKRWDENSQRSRFDGIIQDISERKLAEFRLRYTAEHDSLTRLANRDYFMEQLRILISNPRERRSDRFSLLFIDLDRFKSINDRLGHSIGDQLLINVSSILLDSVRPDDIVARLGGDEFTILLKSVGDASDAARFSERVQRALRHSVVIDGRPITVTASIGIVIDENTYQTAEDMLRDADIAMYQAKKLGKDCHQLFSPSMYQEAINKLTLENEIKLAIKNKEFYLEYQPIKNLLTDKLVGFEALVRWKHPSSGLVSPDEFIPLAEETGLIVPLGEYILREACMQMNSWKQHHAKLPQLTMSVNFSSAQLQEPNFLESTLHIVQQNHLKPSQLKLEITESLLIEKNEKITHLFEQLRHSGFQLSLDDFGTGYSALSYLHRFPINTLKIDRSFIQTLEQGSSSFEIVRTITALARTLHMDVIAEGVETNQQADYLKHLQCDMVQGYLFSKPLNAGKATAYLLKEINKTCDHAVSIWETTETIASVSTAKS